MDQQQWKIGDLAAATGSTIRTLHHFDEIGLLRPAGRSAAGHRLYAGDDVRRLYAYSHCAIWGMTLRDIAHVLDGETRDLTQTICGQLQQADERIARYRHLRRRLLALHAAAHRTPQPSIDQLIDVMEAMMHASYFTQDQLARLKDRHHQVGADGFARWQNRWAQLAADVSAHIERGTDPADPPAHETARRWGDLMQDMSGGDKSVLSAMYAKLDGKGAEAATRGVVSTDVWDYIKRALTVGYSFPGQSTTPGLEPP